MNILRFDFSGRMYFRKLTMIAGGYFILTLLMLLVAPPPVVAIDTDATRKTLSGLQGVYVAVEELQPNLMKYSAAQRAGLSKEGLKRDIEGRLIKAEIRVLTWDQAVKTPGMPFLYVNVNTHEMEKYWYAYDIRIELQQLVSMEANPKVKTLAGTWSTNMTGMVNIGTMDKLTEAVEVLVGRFVGAFRAANPKR
jgi:hypothetical protein